MLTLRYARYWQVLGALLVIVILAAALIPPDDDVGAWLFDYDKLLHGAVFSVLTIWFCGQFERREYGWLVVMLLAFGVLIEVLQMLTAYRKGDVMDFVADAIGVGVGLVIVIAFGLGGWSRNVEDRIGIQSSR